MGANTQYGLQIQFQNQLLFDQAGGDRVAALKAHVNSAAALGVDVIRVPGDWRQLEWDGPGQYSQWYIDELKAIVSHAKSLGVSVVMMLAQTPYWATDKTHPQDSDAAIWSPPTGAAATAYAKAMVKLHDTFEAAGLGDTVVGWEVWNEPNVTPFWPTAKLREGTDIQVEIKAAAEYVKLLNATYNAMKAADPSAVILGGSLAGNDVDYLAKMYELGAKFDALAVHPYAKANPFNNGVAYDPDEFDLRDPLSEVWSFKYGVEKLRDLMIAKGDAGKAMWFTEFGWSADDDWGGVGNEQRQADFMAEALEIIKGWDFVDTAIAYRLFDGAAEKFGMRHADGTLKPVGEVLRDFLAGVAPEITKLGFDGFEQLLASRTACFEKATGEIDAELSEINAVMRFVNGANGQDLRNLMGSSFADRLTGDASSNRIDGSAGDDLLDGGAGNDMLLGGAGNNMIYGGAGDDVIIGGADCDWIEGGAGADRITGGGYHGHVYYRLSDQGVSVNLRSGATSGGDAAGDILKGIDSVDGSQFADSLAGDGADNWVIGNGGNDRLAGDAGSDRVDGGAGNDVVIGGWGADQLIGGAGRDVFDFNALGQSRAGNAGWDVIEDFHRGEDKIDLLTIDANFGRSGNQAFVWIGGQEFHGRAGELRAQKGEGGMIVSADLNGDGQADMQIQLKAVFALSGADFIL